MYILILLRSNPHQAALKGAMSLRGEGLSRRGKTGKHRKVEMKRKWWILVEPPYYLQGNGRQSPRVEPGG